MVVGEKIKKQVLLEKYEREQQVTYLFSNNNTHNIKYNCKTASNNAVQSERPRKMFMLKQPPNEKLNAIRLCAIARALK